MANYKKCFRKIRAMAEDRSIELLADNFQFKTVKKIDKKTGNEKQSVSSPLLDGLTLWIAGVPFVVDYTQLDRNHSGEKGKLAQAFAEWWLEENHGNIMNWMK